MNILLAATEQALLLLPLVFGMYISYRVLKVTDLTVDGTYVLGAAVFAIFIESGILIALILSIMAGIFVGTIVGLMQRHNKVSDLVVGILASFMLYSVNLQVLGKPNISLIGKETILTIINLDEWILPLFVINFSLASSLILLLKCELGLLLRAFGHNQKLLSILGRPAELYRIFGLSLSNGLAALSGALTAQVNGFADISMGFGVALVSIGAVVIGAHILRTQETFNAPKALISCFIGIFLYFICLASLLKIGINPANMKFILGAILFLTLRKIHNEAKL